MGGQPVGPQDTPALEQFPGAKKGEPELCLLAQKAFHEARLSG